MFVEKFSDFFVLKTFAFHDVAPVAGRIADAQENRLVFRARLFKRVVVPREPVHGIVRVLQKIRRFFLREAVCVFGGHETGLTEFYRIKMEENFVNSENSVFKFCIVSAAPPR
jgi:hypothetical protein